SRTCPDSVTVTSTFTMLSALPVLRAQQRRTSPCIEAIFAFASLGISAAPTGQRGLGLAAETGAAGGGVSLAEPPHAETKKPETARIEIEARTYGRQERVRPARNRAFGCHAFPPHRSAPVPHGLRRLPSTNGHGSRCGGSGARPGPVALR